MKAIVQDKYGSVDVLELRDVERPQPGTTSCSSVFMRGVSTRASGI